MARALLDTPSAHLRRPAVLPLLTDADVVVGRERGSLPPRWRMRWETESILSFRTGSMVEVECAAPEPGAVVCLVSAGRLVWRRVLEVRNARALLRADVAPFVDGWFPDVFGRAQLGRLERVIALAPRTWTQSAWWMAHRWAHADVRRFRAVKPQHGPSWTIRKLSGSHDLRRLRALTSRSYGKPFDANPGPGQSIFGLMAGGGELAGFAVLLVAGESGYVAHMLVDPKYRGFGGGYALAQAAVDEARRLHLETVYAHVHALNVVSIRAFERAGFSFARWWSDPADPFVAMERQWHVLELRL